MKYDGDGDQRASDQTREAGGAEGGNNRGIMRDGMITPNRNCDTALLEVTTTRKQRGETSRDTIPAVTMRRNPRIIGPGSMHGRVTEFTVGFRMPKDLMAGRSLTIQTGKHAALIAPGERTVEMVEQGEEMKMVELRNRGKRFLTKRTPELSILSARLMHIR
jgi:hypothetical protein